MSELWRDPNDPKYRHSYCVQRPDGEGGHKPMCISCSIDEEIKIFSHYTICAKKADCSTKYDDKPIWNVTSRLCCPCDPVEGCLDTGNVRFRFPQPLKPMNCSPRGTEIVGQRRCKCPVGWITDFRQNPDEFVWCNTKDWDHIYNVRRRQYERHDNDYRVFIVTSVVGVVISCCFVLCFLSLLQKACRKFFVVRQPRRSFRHQMVHGRKHVP